MRKVSVLTKTQYLFIGRRCLASVAEPQNTEWESAKPYQSIPGPKTLKDTWQLMKLFNLPNELLHKKLNSTYGDIIRLKGSFRRPDLVLLYNPADFEQLLRTEGSTPTRNILETLTYYRKHFRKDVYGEASGLLTEHGPKWATFRTAVNPVMLQPKIVKQYVPGIDEIAVEFTDKIRRERNDANEMGDKFLLDIGTWALESISFIALDTRLNVISSNDTSSDGHKIVQHAREFFEQAYQLEAMPSIWKYVTTPTLSRQMKTLDNLTYYTQKYVNIALEKLKENERLQIERTTEQSVLQKLIKIDKAIAFSMASDMLLAGADTTGSLTTGLLYALAKHPDKQAKLRDEILKILPTKESRLKPEDLNNIPYLRASIKEAARLHTVIAGVLRGAGKDLVIQGYRIPKGTNVSTVNMHVYRSDEHFPESNKFIPERWLKNEQTAAGVSLKLANPFVYLPFGFGARSCIGRRFAELEIECLIARLVRNFEISWKLESELKYKMDFVYSPVAPAKFAFTDVNF